MWSVGTNSSGQPGWNWHCSSLSFISTHGHVWYQGWDRSCEYNGKQVLSFWGWLVDARRTATCGDGERPVHQACAAAPWGSAQRCSWGREGKVHTNCTAVMLCPPRSPEPSPESILPKWREQQRSTWDAETTGRPAGPGNQRGLWALYHCIAGSQISLFLSLWLFDLRVYSIPIY